MRTYVCVLGWTLAMCGTLSIMGCNSGPKDRFSVSGKVTLDGTPVDAGHIRLEPIDAETPAISGALIQEGRYEIPRTTGLAPGKYRVRIFWTEKLDSKLLQYQPPGSRLSHNNVPKAKELIPARYNIESDLTVDVRESEANTFDFTLSTNP